MKYFNFYLFLNIITLLLNIVISNNNNKYGDLIINHNFIPKICSRRSKSGDMIVIHYEASIDHKSPSGKKGLIFDSSIERNAPFQFLLDQPIRKVIEGLDVGLLDICIGEKRTLIIPASMGFGTIGAKPNVPGGAILRYEVNCIDIKSPTIRQGLLSGNVFSEIDINGDWLLTREELLKWFKEKNNANEIPNGLFEKDDIDNNGFISWNEFMGPKGNKGPPGFKFSDEEGYTEGFEYIPKLRNIVNKNNFKDKNSDNIEDKSKFKNIKKEL